MSTLKWRDRARTWPPLRLAMDLRIQVVLLGWLFVLVGWGTLYQVDQGLWAAQQRFFHSWFFLLGGFFPLPGGQLVLTLLTVCLLLSMAFRLALTPNKIGLWLVHLGLASLLIGGALSHHLGKEGFLALAPGQGSDRAEDWREWEIAFFDKDSGTRNVKAVTLTRILPEHRFDLSPWPHTFSVSRQFPNSRRDMTGGLIAAPRENDPSKDLPGVRLEIKAGTSNLAVELWAGDENPTPIGPLRVALRRLRQPLPAFIRLKEFVKEEHPGTSIARRFESRVTLTENGVSRDARIFMNNPLHIGSTTLFQASYTENGPTRSSVLAVSRDHARFLPYVSSGLVFLGLLVHFMVMLGRRLRRQEPS